MIQRPSSNEYASFYATYVDKVPEEDIIQVLIDQQHEISAMLDQVGDEKIHFRYAPEKWSVAELFQHMIDTEKIMAYRALRVARNDKTPLPGFEQDDYAAAADTSKRTVESIKIELLAIRKATISFFQSISNEASEHVGTASQANISVRALAYIIAGHLIHHFGVLKDRYLFEG